MGTSCAVTAHRRRTSCAPCRSGLRPHGAGSRIPPCRPVTFSVRFLRGAARGRTEGVRQRSCTCSRLRPIAHRQTGLPRRPRPPLLVPTERRGQDLCVRRARGSRRAVPRRTTCLRSIVRAKRGWLPRVRRLDEEMGAARGWGVLAGWAMPAPVRRMLRSPCLERPRPGTATRRGVGRARAALRTGVGRGGWRPCGAGRRIRS